MPVVFKAEEEVVPEIVTSLDRAREIISKMIYECVPFGADTETRGIKLEKATITGISLSSRIGNFYFPLNHHEVMREPYCGAMEKWATDIDAWNAEREQAVPKAHRKFAKKPSKPKRAKLEDQIRDLPRWPGNLPEKEFFQILIPLFKTPKEVIKGWHNGPFDWRAFVTTAKKNKVCGFFWPEGMHDSLMLAYALSLHLSQSFGGLDLDTVSKRVLKKEKIEDELNAFFDDRKVKAKGARKSLLWCAPVEAVALYCAQDAYLARKNIKKLYPKVLADEGCTRLYEREMALVKTTIEMEMAPKYLNMRYLRETFAKGTKRLEELAQDVFDLAGREFKIRGEQLAQVLMDNGFRLPYAAKCQAILEAGGQPKKITYSTDAAVLEQYKGQPLIDAILRFRALDKRINTDFASVLEYAYEIKPGIGVIYPNLSQTTARTGRYASSKPNGQNQTRDDEGDEWAKEFSIRKAFLTSPGRPNSCTMCEGDGQDYEHGKTTGEVCVRCKGSGREPRVILSADLKQIEPRWTAHLTRDPNLIDVYLHDRDVYSEIGKYAFDIDKDLDDKTWKKKNPDERQAAKSLVLAILYGAGARKVVIMVTDAIVASIDGQILLLKNKLAAGDLTLEGVQEIKAKIKALKAKKIAFHFTLEDAQRVLARMEERFPNVFSYRYFLEAKYQENGFIRNPFGRMLYLAYADKTYTLLNAMVQSSAADMLKQATLDVYNALKAAGLDAKLIFSVHDELIFDIACKDLEAAIAIITKEMTKFELRVPLAVDISITNTDWASLEECPGGKVEWSRLFSQAA